MNAFVALFISIFSSMLGLAIVAPLLPIYAEELGASGLWVGMIFSAFSLSRAVFMPIVGKISDKYGKKKFILVGLAVYSAISFLYIAAKDVYSLTLVRFLHGFASAMVVPLAMAYIGETSPKGEEGEYMGTFIISLFLGMGIGPFIGGVLKDHFGMDAAFHAMAALAAIAFAVCLTLPESEKKMPKYSFKAILKSRIIKALFIFRTFNALAMAAIMAFLPMYAATIGLSSTEIGLALAANILSAGLLQRPFGRLADATDKVFMIIAGSAAYALGLALVPFTSNFFDVLVLSIAIGISNAAAMPAATALAVVEGREYGLGAVMGIFNTGMSIGVIVSPLLAGLVMDAFGIREVFIFSSSFSLVGLAIFWYMLKSQ